MTHARTAGRLADLAAGVADGSRGSLALVEACLARIAAVDGEVRAWVGVLADAARAEARQRDAEARAGRLRGPLHGLPLGVKDVIDVAGLPTRANSRARAGLPPAAADATVVAHLRAAGAVILGKLHTTEFAYFDSVPPTRNPHDLGRTPGGSSGGSAAAVAAGMVPMALGTQTAGSVNRPAAYCGVGAFKPSTRAIGGAGVVPLAPSFDTVGAFAATAGDAASLAAAFAPAHLGLEGGSADDPVLVVLEDALIAERAAPGTAAAIAAFAAALREAGVRVQRRAAPVKLAGILDRQRIVLAAEMGRLYATLDPDLLAPRLAADIRAGAAIPDAAYHAALLGLAEDRARFWAAFGPADLLLLPAAPDVAPVGIATGDPSFISPLTALGGPLATVPAPAPGLPVGALLAAAPGEDARLAAFLRAQDL